MLRAGALILIKKQADLAVRTHQNQLGGGVVFLFIITLFATNHGVIFAAFPAPGQGHNVIHGEALWWEFSLTIVAKTGGKLELPPMGVPKLPSLLLFLGNISFIDKTIYKHRTHL
jgi:hypothetical protein